MSRLIRGSAFVGTVGSIIAYDEYHPGFRRSVQFWTTLAPTIIEFQYIRTMARLEGEEGLNDLDRRLDEFHSRTALKALDIITSLGGIYVKLAQFAAAMGSGLIMDSYVTALQPLMDGVPPRSIETIIEIIENDLNNQNNKSNEADNKDEEYPKKKIKLSDIFLKFEEESLGAASIAQAHRATLLDGREVVVKVQYPEVAANYIADFDNLEIVAGFFLKESVETVKNLRIRHEYELDFRLEAENLKLCRDNAVKHGFSPKLVSLPSLVPDFPATKNVLVMEYLSGRSMQSAIDDEMNEIATVLGIKGGVKELRKQTMKALKQHFRGGGGGGDTSTIKSDFKKGEKKKGGGNEMMKSILGGEASNHDLLNSLEELSQADTSKDTPLSTKDDSSTFQNKENNENRKMKYLTNLVMSNFGSSSFLLNYGMKILHKYIEFRHFLIDVNDSISILLNNIFNFNIFSLLNEKENQEDKKNQQNKGVEVNGGRIIGSSDGSKIFIKKKNFDNHDQEDNKKNKNNQKKKYKKINLDEKLKDLVKVHGYQLLIDGVFNADPHPGNILVLEDGSLGLIDYGIVGNLSLEDRLKVAKVIVALAEDNLEEAARIYTESGYRIVDLKGNPQPSSLVGRIARFHLDKMDLSLIQLHPTSTETKIKEQQQEGKVEGKVEEKFKPSAELSVLLGSSAMTTKGNADKENKPQSILRVLHQSIELSAPDWQLQSRRLGCLLIGVCTQAGRPISLAKEWEPIARQLIAEHEKRTSKHVK